MTIFLPGSFDLLLASDEYAPASIEVKATVGGDVNSDPAAKMGILRVLRALRLMKLARLVKASRVFKRWYTLPNATSLPPP